MNTVSIVVIVVLSALLIVVTGTLYWIMKKLLK
jgi:hypothetical protein